MDSPTPLPSASAATVRAALAQTAIGHLVAPSSWRSVEFISDLHLQPQLPATHASWQQYLQASTADAIFMLGDLFEAWVGDDALDEPGSFEAQCASILHQASAKRSLFFIHGNRDFLVGSHFAQRCGVQLLTDPTCLNFAGQRWLLSHGDALCVDDADYQRFRTLARSPAWQQQLLAQPLAQRRQLAGSMRSESEARKMREIITADVDHAAALEWLQRASASTLIHGHTHRPAVHALDDSHKRIVLTDWDTDLEPAQARAEVLRIDASGLQRLPLADYLAHPPGLQR
ncbi:UDP-2,3-diacylglucosamine hydrolase [Comamonas odontotermitis]|uniref:UDP-2,3-diacylglucosamine hydrolase n=1 Tax=Comamonas odontotermitis TaxID=379895 RepID=A0ABR6RFL4_9BURK|nr:UDP-2,3-diacylglucosamine diphosphatase [Comamonas odontotermitis]MBB6577956.1 UDP-2,3-diacylglucosamine hydrolase [Comamonas odontotermitis]